MKIEWIGHSCFLITVDAGATLLTDPYDTEAYQGTLLYRQVDLSPDIVTISHAHADHAGVRHLGGAPRILDSTGEYDIDGFDIRGVATFHDSSQGSQRGSNTVFVVRADGVTVAHLGDLGHELSSRQVDEIGPLDIVLLPVGGVFTIDAARATRVWQQLGPPAVAIPMHFRNDKCHFSIEGVSAFLEGKSRVETPGVSELEPVKENLSGGPKIVVLDPAY